MSGFDASKTIRLMASDIPIIALTATALQGTRDKCIESGMNDYLTKPLRLNQLKDILSRWLGED
jgi:CheY-like chemotaxis protein